ncbi:MAG: 4-(cytidine 5'-diphospho)-2-C-methyl-D-erythritol kinase [Rhodospirillales bacterium]
MNPDMRWEAAPAKVNLCLHVTGRRADGYHLLDSLTVFCAVGDRLSVRPADDLRLSLSGPRADGLSARDDNLVLRAARGLAALTGCGTGAELILEKCLPVASGIGGGSADAAAALRLLCRFWQVDPAPVALQSLALSLGADVPVCLNGHASRMTGIGETLVDLPPLPPMTLLLVNPGQGVSTPAVFKARQGSFSGALPTPDWGREPRGLVGYLQGVGNDLEAPARDLCPVIGDVLAALARLPGAFLVRMSGSGATCFALFDDASLAQSGAESITAAHPDWWAAAGAMLT